jgi:RNA recognition motif-containing protein
MWVGSIFGQWVWVNILPSARDSLERVCEAFLRRIGLMTIFVANLPLTVTESELHDCFAQYGNVADVRIAQDRITGNFRGFGFVTMPDDHEAITAIRELDGRDWDGRAIHVDVARERVAR